MAYYVWLIRRDETVIVVDTGFNAASGAKRGRRLLRSPTDGLRALGVDPDAVGTLIVTHLHYDHIGNADLFPSAKLHVQDKEVAFVTGRHMRHAFFRSMYEVVGFVRDVHAGRVVFRDGDAEIAPGVTVHRASGHTPGVQSCASIPAAAGSCSHPTPITTASSWSGSRFIRSCTIPPA